MSNQLSGLTIQFTSNTKDISEASHVLISVPTILNEDKTIGTTYLRTTIATVEKHVKPGSPVVVESSVAVGMAHSLVGPLMASKNLKFGLSPERIDSGHTFPTFENTPKIIFRVDAASLDSISSLYSRIFANILPVSSPETAEKTKLTENCQRMVCTAYANEMAEACTRMVIDAFEVSEAATSEPFGYVPFRPGPVIGRYCIPVNPYYFLSNCEMPLLEQATAMSWKRPENVAKRLVWELMHDESPTKEIVMNPSQLRVLVVGVGFKREQSVMSNSPGAAIVRALKKEYGSHVESADPLVGTELYNEVRKMDTNMNWNVDYLSTYDGWHHCCCR